MRTFLFAAALLFGPLLLAEDLQVGGLKRSYLIQLPQGQGPWPLVMALHGGGGHAKSMEKLTGLGALGFKRGFAVVYPEAVNKHWNDGRGGFASQSDADDAQFLLLLRQKLIQDKIANPSQIYICGISNGGMMTLRMACEHPELFAAAGVVAMSMSAARDCHPSGGLPICFINGTADPLVPFAGGDIRLFKGGRSRGKLLPVEESIQFWAKQNHIHALPQISQLPDLDPDDGTRVELRSYGADVQAYVVDQGGHAWPGGWKYLGEWLVGKVSRDFNASEALWDFFSRHLRARP